jgi:diguanylate cyclase (GGDEF)-like protein/PAS domain S-box-containing protein
MMLKRTMPERIMPEKIMPEKLLKDAFYKELMDNLYDGVYFVDRDRTITFWNKGAERLTGYSKSNAQGRSCFDDFLAHVDDTGKRLCDEGCPLTDVLVDGQSREEDLYLHHLDGHRVPVSVRVSPIRDEKGEIIGAVEIFSDNSTHVANQRRIDELEQLALLDSLTRIGNRRYLEMTLEAKLAETARYNTQIAIFFMDIDDFKDINDTWGHDVGDEVLKAVAGTLNAVMRPMDLLGRWGGEEFIAAATNVNRGTARSIGERFRKLIEGISVPAGDERVHFTISVGATIARPDDDLASIVKRADQQMYEAKKAGKNRVAAN